MGPLITQKELKFSKAKQPLQTVWSHQKRTKDMDRIRIKWVHLSQKEVWILCQRATVETLFWSWLQTWKLLHIKITRKKRRLAIRLTRTSLGCNSRNFCIMFSSSNKFQNFIQERRFNSSISINTCHNFHLNTSKTQLQAKLCRNLTTQLILKLRKKSHKK